MKNKIILIGGGSASGKTLLAKALMERFPDEITYLSCDMYCRPHPWLSLEERAKLNYDHPDAYAHELLYEHLCDLKENKDVKMPIYDFATHDRKEETILVKPNKYIIIDGILTLHYEELLKVSDFNIYMDAREDVRLERRTYRDIHERGRTKESVLKQFKETVAPMHNKFVEPSKAHADFIYVNNENNGLNKEIIDEIVLKIKSL